MKKIFVLILIVSSMSLGQDWNQTVTTTLNEPNLSKMDLFTNKDGNHLLIKRTDGNIVYYNLNSSGIVNASKTITLETTGDFPNIVGAEDKIIAIYKVGNLIKGKYSTNGGTNWTALSYNISTSANECNGVDAVYDPDRGVHLVWATRDNGSDFETYYQRLNVTNTPYQWVDYKQVTDYTGEVGGQPSVTFSTNRVHVSYNTNYYSEPVTGNVKSRDKYLNTWQVPQNVIVGSEQSALEKIIARGDSLFLVFSKFINGVPIRFDLCTKKRSITGSTWSNTTVLQYNTFMEDFSVSKTEDNKLHTIYKPGGLLHKVYNGIQWSSAVQITDNYEYTWGLGLHFSSNDLFAIWLNSDSDFIRFRHYDAAPLAPQNLSIGSNPGDGMVRLQWTANTEADLALYQIWRKIDYAEDWRIIGTTTNTYYVDSDMLYLPIYGLVTTRYKIKAKDVENHYSDYSNEVSSRTEPLNKISGEENAGIEYRLNQNYPNPFNPTTKIKYSIKEEVLVILKVYDILGKEVATLVNENKPEGNYEAEFNASQLPSGMYMYKIQSGNFTDVKKMLLTK